MTAARFAHLSFWSGILLYVTALFLPFAGIRGVNGQAPPSGVAVFVDWIIFPWVYTHWHGFQAFVGDSPIKHPSLVISGCINPVFLLGTVLVLMNKAARTIRRVRYLVFLMIPFTWIVFVCDHTYPREGYVLWVLGMVLVLYPDRQKANRAI